MRRLVAAGVVLVSLPYWLPKAVVALRMRIFARINGEEAIEVPGPRVDSAHFKQVYAHPAARGRSKGAALSDLFWYWLAPGPHVHQEHLEDGDRYESVARTTRRILSIPSPAAESLTTQCAGRVLDEQPVRDVDTVRLRDLMMPIWAEFYYELIFAERCPAAARRLIVDNANDVVTALKCCGLRHMRKRRRLTRYLIDRLTSGEVPQDLPASLTLEEQAYYLQGTYFNTAVVQMSEAMTHVLLVLAQHKDIQDRLVADPSDDRYLDRVIDETLRAYPLFGVAHRITSAEIAIDGVAPIPAGSVLCFSYPGYQSSGFSNGDEFDPDRWEALSAKDASYIPFGIAANRPCPAWRLSPITMRAATREILARYALYSSASHTRSIPHRGPCVLVRRPGHQSVAARLAAMRVRDRIDDMWRSIVQLVLGTYMVADARRLGLAERYFRTHDLQGRPHSTGCPMENGAR